MKRQLLFLAAGAVAFLASCTGSEPGASAGGMRTIEMTIGALTRGVYVSEGDTRVSYDDLAALWEEDDVIMVGFADAAGRTYGPFEFRASQAGAVSDFTGSVTVGEETTVLTKIYAYYYGSGVTGVNADLRAGTLAFGLPAVQNGNLSDYTLGVAYATGEYSVKAGTTEFTLPAGFAFRPSLARLDVNVTGLAAGETVQSVTVGLDGYTFYDGGTVDFAGTAEPVFSAADVNAAVRVLPGVSASGDPAGYMVGIVPLDLGGRSARMDVTVITRSGQSGKRYTASILATELAAATRYVAKMDVATLQSEEVTYIEDGTLDAINNDKDGYFILTDDMTLDAMPNITDFGGTLDGDGHTIDMGTVGSVSSEQAGIFATTTGDAAIVNLNVKVESLEGDASEGGLIVGKVKDGTLTLDNVHASGSITATRYGDSNHMFGGGLVGFVPMGAVLEAANCSFTGSVSTNMTALIDANAYNCYVGGIVGALETGVDSFEKNTDYAGSEAGAASSIVNCRVFDAALVNTWRGGTSIGGGIAVRSEFYTGGIAGRCTGRIENCSVENTHLTGVVDTDGAGRQAKPVVGNDWYEYTFNENNSYTNVTVNGGEARTGLYRGAGAAGTDRPDYSDIQ